LLTAAAADGGTAADSALATLMGVLGTDAMAGEAGSVLAVPARDQRARPGLGRVLGLVDQQRWISGTRIADLLNQASPAPVALVPGSVPAGRVAAARSAIHGETGVRHLGRAADASGPLTGPHRLGLVAVLSAAWRSDERGYPKAVATVDRAFAAFRNQVRFDQGSSITYIGGSGSLPVRVVNNLTRPVRIEVSGLASNGRLRVVGTASATIAPESLGLVKLPVRSISNGTVDVTLTLRTPDGYPIGTSSTASITVNTGWETVGAIVFVVALLALFGTGVYRNVRRARRKTRRTT
jgi:hypothetical protein